METIRNEISNINAKLNKFDKILSILIKVLTVFLALDVLTFFGGLIFKNSPNHFPIIYQANGSFQPYVLGIVALSVILAIVIIPFFVFVTICEKNLEHKKRKILENGEVSEEELSADEIAEATDDKEPVTEDLPKEEPSHQPPTLTTKIGVDYHILKDETQLMLVSIKKIKL